MRLEDIRLIKLLRDYDQKQEKLKAKAKENNSEKKSTNMRRIRVSTIKNVCHKDQESKI